MRKPTDGPISWIGRNLIHNPRWAETFGLSGGRRSWTARWAGFARSGRRLVVVLSNTTETVMSWTQRGPRLCVSATTLGVLFLCCHSARLGKAPFLGKVLERAKRDLVGGEPCFPFLTPLFEALLLGTCLGVVFILRFK